MGVCQRLPWVSIVDFLQEIEENKAVIEQVGVNLKYTRQIPF